jgi:hypothetical protein
MATEKPKGTEEFDERYWREFRASSRKHAGAQILLVIGFVGIAVCILRMLDPMSYPAGDERNTLGFTLLSNGVGILMFVILIALAVHVLRTGRRPPE